MATKEPTRKYTAISGFFAHYDGPTGPSHEVTTSPGLGLIDRPYETDKTFDPHGEKQPWERFVYYLHDLNKNSDDKVSYKLMYATRHGEGFHNVKEAEVGTEAWEAYWAKLDGDGKTVWADAKLTEKGTGQALAMKEFWQESASTLRLPLPPRHYANPLTRCLDTCRLAFSGIELPSGMQVPPFKPIIKELARERLGVHTCDRRHPRSWIAENHAGFVFEDGFSEEDELWKPDVRETLDKHAVRIRMLLDELFTADDAQVISLTVHSGSILALYEVIGHPEVRLAPGTIVPVFIKSEVNHKTEM